MVMLDVWFCKKRKDGSEKEKLNELTFLIGGQNVIVYLFYFVS